MLHPASARLDGARANISSAHPESTRSRAANTVRQRQPTPSTAPAARSQSNLAVHGLNSFGRNGRRVRMESNDRQRGWVISQIERLIEMPRRDIQRACYTGAGGTGTVTPKDSTWGKRAYEVEDLALLLLINLRRSDQRGLTATAREVARDLQHSDLVDLLQAQRERIEEELEQAEASLLRVRAAQAACGIRHATRVPQFAHRARPRPRSH